MIIFSSSLAMSVTLILRVIVDIDLNIWSNQIKGKEKQKLSFKKSCIRSLLYWKMMHKQILWLHKMAAHRFWWFKLAYCKNWKKGIRLCRLERSLIFFKFSRQFALLSLVLIRPVYALKSNTGFSCGRSWLYEIWSLEVATAWNIGFGRKNGWSKAVLFASRSSSCGADVANICASLFSCSCMICCWSCAYASSTKIFFTWGVSC